MNNSKNFNKKIIQIPIVILIFLFSWITIIPFIDAMIFNDTLCLPASIHFPPPTKGLYSGFQNTGYQQKVIFKSASFYEKPNEPIFTNTDEINFDPYKLPINYKLVKLTFEVTNTKQNINPLFYDYGQYILKPENIEDPEGGRGKDVVKLEFVSIYENNNRTKYDIHEKRETPYFDIGESILVNIIYGINPTIKNYNIFIPDSCPSLGLTNGTKYRREWNFSYDQII